MELISIHVPKTAGTAFTKVLTQNYGRPYIYFDNFPKNLSAISPDVKVIHGHFDVKRYESDFPEAKRMAWIRHPVKRMISFYYYSKNGVRIEQNKLRCKLQDENLSLAEFIELPRARNIISSFFHDQPLEDFFFIGVQEYFDDDLATLGRMLDWKHLAAPRDNTNVEPGYRERVKAHLEDKALVRRMEELNVRDMELYERVVKLRSRRQSPTTVAVCAAPSTEARQPLTWAQRLGSVGAALRRRRAA